MNNNTFVHKYIRSLIGKDDVVADLTAGNGNDTLFLSSLAGHVYAFDISPEAIRKTRKRLGDADNVTLICDSHSNLDQYIKEEIHLFVFNLGYLPHSDTLSVTKADSTLSAFIKAYELLENGGYIVITFYFGHSGGKEEFLLMDSYIKKNRFHIIEIYSQDKADSPLTYILRKIS